MINYLPQFLVKTCIILKRREYINSIISIFLVSGLALNHSSVYKIGTRKWVIGDWRTTSGDGNTNGILFDGIWLVSSYTEHKPKKSFESNQNLPWASLTWKHGVEAQAD